MSDTLLETLQRDVAERLRSDALISTLTVVTERDGDILASIQRALGLVTSRAGNRGLCLTVLQITANPASLDAPGPVLDMVVAVRVLENPVLNNVPGQTALTIARRVTRLLHHYTPIGISSCLTPGTPLITPVVDPEAPVAYEVQFVARQSDFDVPDRVADPAISAPASTTPTTVTISCATADAAIYYTTDGSYPRLEGATSTRYSAPFALSSPATVRATAYAPDLMPSNTASLTLS
jgi:hypothetical protein